MLIRFDDSRIPKQMLYGELLYGTWPQHKPNKNFKDCLRDSLENYRINDPELKTAACDRYKWSRKIIEVHAMNWKISILQLGKGKSLRQQSSNLHVINVLRYISLMMTADVNKNVSHISRLFTNYYEYCK